jgi:hypothetical protein
MYFFLSKTYCEKNQIFPYLKTPAKYTWSLLSFEKNNYRRGLPVDQETH